MIVYTPVILGQIQKYTLILKEQITENFLFSIEGAIIWNSLPNDTKELKSSNAFKKVLHHVQSAKKYSLIVILYTPPLFLFSTM